MKFPPPESPANLLLGVVGVAIVCSLAFGVNACNKALGIDGGNNVTGGGGGGRDHRGRQ